MTLSRTFWGTALLIMFSNFFFVFSCAFRSFTSSRSRATSFPSRLESPSSPILVSRRSRPRSPSASLSLACSLAISTWLGLGLGLG